MTSSSKTTTDRDEIRQWAEARGGKPATVKRTEGNDEVGVLRIDFPGYSGAGSLEEITWDEFFRKFDEKNLAFLYQEKISSGEESRFFKLVSRDTAEHKSHATSHKVEDQHESKTHAKSEHKTDKVEDKHESKSHAKSEHKTAKAEDKHEAKSHSKSDKAENKSESKAHKSESKSKSHK